MQRVSMIRLESSRLGRAVQTLANSCVLETKRGVFEAQVLRFSAPAAEGSASRAQQSPLLSRCERRPKGRLRDCHRRVGLVTLFRDAALLVSGEEGAP